MNLQQDAYQIHKARLQCIQQEAEHLRQVDAIRKNNGPANSGKRLISVFLQILTSLGR